jgi:multiple sugar transport system permease protein
VSAHTSRNARRHVGWGAASILVIVYALIPVVWIISLSLKKSSDLQDGKFLPSSITWDNYSKIFDENQFTAALRNSIGIALISTAIAIALATTTAYAIARLEFPGKRLVLGAALAIAMFPAISVVSPMFDIWRRVGLYDTWPGLIIPYMTFTLPLAIWTLSAFFREIPWELEQAAQADGATPFQAFRRVIVPLAAPGMFTAAILTFIFAWNDFLFAISLTSSDRARTAPAAIAFFNGNSQFQQPTGSIAAAAVIITIPIVVMVLIFQRRIVSGLTSGAVKG